MRAIQIVELTGPDHALKLVDLPDPEPGPGEALIDVAYAALNFFDLPPAFTTRILRLQKDSSVAS